MPIALSTIKIRFIKKNIGNMGNGKAETVVYSGLATLPMTAAQAPTGNHGQYSRPHSDLTKTRWTPYIGTAFFPVLLPSYFAQPPIWLRIPSIS